VLTLDESQTTTATDERQSATESAAAAAGVVSRAASEPAPAAARQQQRIKRAGDNRICARQKLIKRECKANQNLTGFAQPLQPNQPANAQVGPSGAAAKLKQIQRRRLKQIQLKQAAPAASRTGAGQPAAVTTTTTTAATTGVTTTKLGPYAKPS
jgi:hypothetical protein